MSTEGTENRNSSGVSGQGPRFKLLPRKSGWSRTLRYALAVTVTVVTLLVYLALSSDFGYQPAPIFFLLPIALSSYLGGLGPGLLSMGLSVLASDYFIVSTDHTFRIRKSGQPRPVDHVTGGRRNREHPFGVPASRPPDLAAAGASQRDVRPRT